MSASEMPTDGTDTNRVEVRSWAYPHVIQALQELAQRGEVDLSDLETLLKISRTQAWGVAEVAGREGSPLAPLAFEFDDIAAAIPQRVRAQVAQILDLDLMRSDAKGALRLSEAASGSFGYHWLEQRSIMARYLYLIACKIQKPDFETVYYDKESDGETDFEGDRSASEELIRTLYGYGWDKEDPKLQEAIERLELQLGLFWCVQMLGLVNKHKLDPLQLTRNGHKKYGIPDQEGINGCYWDGGCPCMCGGRWKKMEFARTERSEEDVYKYGLPEMDLVMWVAYGGARNSSFSPLMGVVRALSEGGGEEAFVEIMIELGSSLANYRQKMGALFQETRHVLDRKGKLEEAVSKYREVHQLGDDDEIEETIMQQIEQTVMREQLYAEAADAAISWPCLVAQSFGLSMTRSVKRALEYISNQSGTDLVVPDDISQTVRVA